MFQKIRSTLLWALICVPTLPAPSYANTTQPAQDAISVEYELVPNQPQEFTNYLFWVIEATCVIMTTDDSDDLLAQGISKKGKINNIELRAGQSMTLTVHPMEVFKLSADSGAKVRFTNLGAHTFRAACTA